MSTFLATHLPGLPDVKVDLEEGVGVAVEDSGNAVLVHQVDVFQPVDVRAGRLGHQVHVVDQRPVELYGNVRRSAPRCRCHLGGQARRAFTQPGCWRSSGIASSRPPSSRTCFSSSALISASAASSSAGNVVRPGQRDLGHGRGLDGQRAQVLGLKAVHAVLPQALASICASSVSVCRKL